VAVENRINESVGAALKQKKKRRGRGGKKKVRTANGWSFTALFKVCSWFCLCEVGTVVV
jgi:hypothetical protein